MKRFIFTFTLLVSAVLSVILFSTEASAEENSFYRYLDGQVEKRTELVDITSYASGNNWSSADIRKEITGFYLSRPELFFVERNFKIMTDEAKTVFYVEFDYKYSVSETEKMMKKLDTAAKKVIEGIDKDMSDAEKVLYVHDYIISSCEYDENIEKFSAYDCLVNNSAVCMGYALAYELILEDYLGIECSVVVSDSENHSWNYVKIGNKWYHSDLTADDGSIFDADGNSLRDKGKVSHENVLLSDNMCKKTSELHSNWYVIGDYPAAKSTVYDNCKWRGSDTAMEYRDGKWYLAISEAEGKKLYSKIYSYDFSAKKYKLIKKVASKWYVRRLSKSGEALVYGTRSYANGYTKLVIRGDYLYYNTASEVYKYSFRTGKTSKVYTLKKKKGQQIYSIAENGNKLKVCYKYDMTYKDNYLNIKLA